MYEKIKNFDQQSAKIAKLQYRTTLLELAAPWARVATYAKWPKEFPVCNGRGLRGAGVCQA